MTFAVGRPDFGVRLGRSAHQKLADLIDGGKNTVAGHFRRGPGGEIYTDENTGHYWKFWSDDVRHLLPETLSKWTGCKAVHEG